MIVQSAVLLTHASQLRQGGVLVCGAVKKD